MKILLKISVLFLLLAPVPVSGREYVLFFKKTIPSQHSPDNSRIIPYRVKEGDCIYLILKHMGIKEGEIPRLFPAIKRLNPGVKDINRLFPGQIIYLPLPIKKKGPAPRSHPSYPYVTFPYKVKRGDNLVKLLKKKGHIPTSLIFNEYLDIFKSLNPSIKDINSLRVGEKILLPVRISPSGPGRSQGSPSTGHPIYSPPLPSTRKSSPMPQSLSILKALGFSILQGEDILYPLKEGGWLTLDTKRTPLLIAPWGKKIILLPRGTSAPSIRGLAREVRIDSWEPYRVLKAIAHIFPRMMVVWTKGRNLIIPCRGFVVESRARLQVVIFKNKNKRSAHYYLFFSSPLKNNYKNSLLLTILEKGGIHLFHLKEGIPVEMATIKNGLTNLYIPTIYDSPLSHIFSSLPTKHGPEQCVRSLAPHLKLEECSIHYRPFVRLCVSFSVWKLRRGKGREIYLVGGNLRYVVALLNISGYSAYLVPVCP